MNKIIGEIVLLATFIVIAADFWWRGRKKVKKDKEGVGK